MKTFLTAQPATACPFQLLFSLLQIGKDTRKFQLCHSLTASFFLLSLVCASSPENMRHYKERYSEYP
jgi:hypothetical protein